ncbi:Uu.00g006860.m01.CDS01 [Anthostomella pinea]|uniref:Uu.00g006860.m01.CDS01 n=1 Tax=Anthostomella pinea TaxID=933095 RepID=A0AAI8YIX8_9PEZI|nr:Uu.00g006860.m01.CDS01 [Anthostomella pinea]
MASSRASEGSMAQNSGTDAAASETTPLLATSPVAPAGDPDVADAIATSSPKSQDKPLPKRQILLLCYARMIEPIAFFSIFPYINQMVQENGNLADDDVGFYSGLIESLFSLTMMVVMMFWGAAADRLGRKPVLVFSLVGVALATALFGLAKTVWQMILFRCLAGVFAGTIVTIRTMISEHSTSHTQARAFGWFAFSGNLGILIGPLLGGALADPAGQYPRTFGGVWFFEVYPYALSSIVVGCIGLTAVFTSALFVEETLHREPKGGNEAGTAPKPPAKSTWQLLKSRGVGAVLYNYGHVMLLAFAYTAIVPVFWFTKVHLGGLHFSPLQISLFMGLTGFSQAIWLLVFFPPLQHRFGTNWVMRACGNAYPFFMAGMPFLNLLLRQGTDAATTAFWVVTPIALVVGPGVSMAFTAAQLALNDVSPSPQSLGMLNAVALTISSALRSFSPALFASLFAIGAKNQFFYGYFVWIIMAVLALGFTISTRFLPQASEKDNEDLTAVQESPSEEDSDDTVRGD